MGQDKEQDETKEPKAPVPGTIRIRENGTHEVWVDNSKPGKSRKHDYITPNSIRDKELEDLRHKLSTAKRLGWLLFVLGLLLGVLISWTFSGIC